MHLRPTTVAQDKVRSGRISTSALVESDVAGKVEKTGSLIRQSICNRKMFKDRPCVCGWLRGGGVCVHN